MKNKHLVSIIFYCLGLIFFLYSCNKNEELIEEQLSTKDDITIISKSTNSKDDLIEKFINLSDEEIAKLDFDLVEVLKENLTNIEKELVVAQRVKSNSNEYEGNKLISFFEEFKEKTKVSFFDASETQITQYLKMNGSPLPSVTGCIYCTSVQVCPEQSEFVYYRSDRLANLPVISRDCNRSLGSTDCDNSYDWVPPTIVYNNPSGYDLISYTQNAVYRFFMSSSFSGFKRQDSQTLSTFLGNRHEIAMGFAWITSFCPHDDWMNATKFGFIFKLNEPR